MATTKKTTAKKTATTKKTTTKKTATKSPVEIITPDIVGTSAGKIWNTLNAVSYTHLTLPTKRIV